MNSMLLIVANDVTHVHIKKANVYQRANVGVGTVDSAVSFRVALTT